MFIILLVSNKLVYHWLGGVCTMQHVPSYFALMQKIVALQLDFRARVSHERCNGRILHCSGKEGISWPHLYKLLN